MKTVFASLLGLIQNKIVKDEKARIKAHLKKEIINDSKNLVIALFFINCALILASISFYVFIDELTHYLNVESQLNEGLITFTTLFLISMIIGALAIRYINKRVNKYKQLAKLKPTKAITSIFEPLKEQLVFEQEKFRQGHK